MSERRVILNAFRPRSAAALPSQFAGRKDEIQTLVDTLHEEGSCPIIFGDRGIGKSSTAIQIERIALGDVELLDEYGLSDRALHPNERFIAFNFSCTDGVTSTNSLLRRLINTAKGYSSASDLTSDLETTRKSSKINLKVYEYEVAKTYRTRAKEGSRSSLSIEEKFELISNQVIQTTNSRVLYIIDELDRARDTKGLASIIKNMSSHQVKFILVGVGQNVSTLLDDHASLERPLVQIHIHRMRDDDCARIVHKAQTYLQQNGLNLQFSHGAVAEIVQAADGFPWFVQTFGHESLLIAHEGKRKEVTEGDVRDAIASIGLKKHAQQFYDKYQQAVGDSSPREYVLRLFAMWRNYDIPTSDIYPLARELGVQNPSLSVKDLQTERYGKVLVKPPYAESGVYRFRNKMFKHYVKLRGAVYSSVKENVDRLWEARRGS